MYIYYHFINVTSILFSLFSTKRIMVFILYIKKKVIMNRNSDELLDRGGKNSHTLLVIALQCLTAWIVAFMVYQIGSIIL